MEIKRVTCYGSGVIGSGWATTFAMAGLQTTVFDLDQEKLDSCKKNIEQNLNFFHSEGVITQSEYDECMSKLTFTLDPKAALENAQLVQENGPENLEIKRKIAVSIELYAPNDSIITSSTSGLMISDIASDTNHPERFVGAHPYNPVHLIPLVELTQGQKTDPKVLEKACEFYKRVKKEPIVLRKEALGFISNRIQIALYREAVDLVCRGVCTMDEIDRAVCYGPGLRYGLMGPNAIFQLGGGAHGIHGLLSHVGATAPLWWKDMALWTDWPEGYIDGVQAQMDEVMALRDEAHGRTNETMARFRDKGLIMLLKYHGKL